MSKVVRLNNFKTSYNKLRKNMKKKYLIELYHYSFPGEPVFSVLDNVNEIATDVIEGESFISICTLMNNTDIVFGSSSFHTNISNGGVVFSSKNDNETYCIIEFI